MSLRLWWDSLLSPDVTVGRAVPAANPFYDWAVLNARVHAARAEREIRDAKERAREQNERMRRTIEEQNRQIAAYLAAQDRPPVRQGRDL